MRVGRRTRNAHRFKALAAIVAVLAPGCEADPKPALSTGPEPETNQPEENQRLDDADISAAVEKELLFDGVVDTDAVMVSTTDGIVSLTGSVDHLLAKERAARLAESVKGVRSVINRLGIAHAALVPSGTLKARIEDALLFDPVTESFEVKVSATPAGKVTLEGSVDSWAERRIAEKVVKRVSGVTAVENEIGVESAEKRTDNEIKQEIERRLHWDTLVDDALLSVTVEGGDVTLRGTVGSAAERNRAYSDAWIPGVNEVDIDAVEVEWWARDEMQKDKYTGPSDDAIRKAIVDAALYDPRVAASDITPRVVNGVATLKGSVKSQKARRAAGQIARNTVGVVDVKNEIQVDPLKADSGQLRDRIKSALAINPITEAFEIIVKVTPEGHATLQGIVDNFAEKAEAEDIASTARGVVSVTNEIEVDDTPYAFVHERYLFPYYPVIEPKQFVPQAPRDSDQMIAAQIRDELFWSPFVDRDQVTVSVSDGVATLTGEVDTWGERVAATENAYEGGAIKVENRLEIAAD